MSSFGLQLATLAMIGSLFALTGLRQFFVHPVDNPAINVFWFLVQVLPLLLVLPGLLRLKSRSFFLTALISTLYFVHGVLLIVDPADRVMGLFEGGFAVTLLSVSVWYVKKVVKNAASKPPQVDQ